jgi:hypothetical protein
MVCVQGEMGTYIYLLYNRPKSKKSEVRGKRKGKDHELSSGSKSPKLSVWNVFTALFIHLWKCSEIIWMWRCHAENLFPLGRCSLLGRRASQFVQWRWLIFYLLWRLPLFLKMVSRFYSI